MPKEFEFAGKRVKITTPPIHTHYSPESDRAEVCGKVFCPHGFVGIEVITTKGKENEKY